MANLFFFFFLLVKGVGGGMLFTVALTLYSYFNYVHCTGGDVVGFKGLKPTVRKVVLVGRTCTLLFVYNMFLVVIAM